MPIELELYESQSARWPAAGRHILAQFDDQSVVVYQAYRPAIGRFAAEHQRFGGEFSFGRMSWIKPNFLWMMYRCGWATKPDQEVVLAVRIRREAFDQILSEAVHSSFVPEVYGDHSSWKSAIERSNVRLQWDPDHRPTGEPVERRAIQLGMRGETLQRYATEWILDIADVTPLAIAQAPNTVASRRSQLATPREHVYSVADTQVAAKLGIAPFA